MQPIATKIGVSRSLLCVCWSHWCAVQKRLNLSRYRLGAYRFGVWLPWAQGTMY